jgi:hypothetical protein
MPHYRIRLIGRGEHACRSVELELPSDDAAVTVIQSHVRGPAMELWEDERLVARFEAMSPPASEAPAEVP